MELDLIMEDLREITEKVDSLKIQLHAAITNEDVQCITVTYNKLYAAEMLVTSLVELVEERAIMN